MSTTVAVIALVLAYSALLAVVAHHKERIIMALIDDIHSVVLTEFNQIHTELDGVQSDLNELKQKIADLEASGGLTPEAQAKLAEIGSMVTGVRTRVADINAQHPVPPPPPPPPVEPT